MGDKDTTLTEPLGAGKLHLGKRDLASKTQHLSCGVTQCAPDRLAVLKSGGGQLSTRRPGSSYKFPQETSILDFRGDKTPRTQSEIFMEKAYHLKKIEDGTARYRGLRLRGEQTHE